MALLDLIKKKNFFFLCSENRKPSDVIKWNNLGTRRHFVCAKKSREGF